MATLKNTDGIVLQGWMVTELHLELGDLITFALVHQFCQSNAGEYYGNTAYLSSWTGWSENTSRRHLTNLVEAGLIEPVRGRENNLNFCRYHLSPDFYEKHPAKIEGSPLKNCGVTPQKLQKAPLKNCGEDNNNVDNNKDNKHATLSRALVRDNPPTEKEVAEYARQRGFADPAGFAAYYIAVQTEAGWMSGKGKNRKPIDNWKLNVLAWEPNHKFDTYNSPTPKAPSPRPSTAGAVNNPNQFWK